LSKIIRNGRVAPTVFVGEKHFDIDRQHHAVSALAGLFPLVAVTTDPDGAKFIPIEEIHKIQTAWNEAHQSAYEEGRTAGHEAGLQQGLTKAEEVLKQFDGAIKDVVQQRASLLEEAKQKVLELVIQVSRKVTFDAVEADPELTLRMISGVIDSLLDRSRLKIKVNPAHLPIIEQHIETFMTGSTTIKEIAIEPDPRVKHGGCFIETPTGDIDARLESQLDVVEETILADEDGR